MDGGVEDKGVCMMVNSSLAVSNGGGDGARRGVGLTEENEDDGLLFFLLLIESVLRVGLALVLGWASLVGRCWAAPRAAQPGKVW
jgi:hypothetical protein